MCVWAVKRDAILSKRLKCGFLWLLIRSQSYDLVNKNQQCISYHIQIQQIFSARDTCIFMTCKRFYDEAGREVDGLLPCTIAHVETFLCVYETFWRKDWRWKKNITENSESNAFTKTMILMPEAICHLVESTWKNPSNIKMCDWLSFGSGERYSSKYFIVIYLSALKQCHTKELVFCIQ